MNDTTYRNELDHELGSILRYWMLSTPDEQHGGFIGRIDAANIPHPDAPKGLVLNCRILWTFSAAWRQTGIWILRPLATRAYEYINTHFVDRDFGGLFWSLHPSGQPLNTRKQIYGQAFALYGISEYYRATGDQAALEQAISLYRLIENYGSDPEHQGYFEAFSRDWSSLEDVRLSEKDDNEKKTTNTNLHVLEAYTNLYHAWPDALLRRRISALLEVFTRHIIDATTGHLRIFFTADWQPRSTLISYGHDIEAAWLLYAAADAIDHATPDATEGGIMHKTRNCSIKLATAATTGLDTDGALWYEKQGDHLIREKHWWPQAEAMVGFFYAWRISGDQHWLKRSMAAWEFVKCYLRDPNGNEWYWGVLADGSPMPGQDKAGFWKCPYHNSRACLEIIRALGCMAV
jgi:mannobiose 2-epimerase